jgi:hypothetical protein
MVKAKKNEKTDNSKNTNAKPVVLATDYSEYLLLDHIF